jgi:hypothetical protein
VGKARPRWTDTVPGGGLQQVKRDHDGRGKQDGEDPKPRGSKPGVFVLRDDGFSDKGQKRRESLKKIPHGVWKHMFGDVCQGNDADAGRQSELDVVRLEESKDSGCPGCTP